MQLNALLAHLRAVGAAIAQDALDPHPLFNAQERAELAAHARLLESSLSAAVRRRYRHVFGCEAVRLANPAEGG